MRLSTTTVRRELAVNELPVIVDSFKFIGHKTVTFVGTNNRVAFRAFSVRGWRCGQETFSGIGVLIENFAEAPA